MIPNQEIINQYDYMPLLKGPDGKDPVVADSAFGWCGNGGVITTACTIPEVAVRWIDYWYDPMRSMECIEGKIGDRLIEQSDGTFTISETPPEGMSIGSWRNNSCLAWTGLWWVSYEDYTEGKNIRIPSADKKVAYTVKHYNPYFKTDYFPPVMYTKDESERLSDIQTNFTSFIETKVTEWIRNGQVEKEWDSYLAELDKIGLPTLLEINQAAYERYLKG